MKQEQKTHVSADALIQLLKGAKSIRWQLALGVVMSLVLVVCALVIPTQMGALVQILIDYFDAPETGASVLAQLAPGLLALLGVYLLRAAVSYGKMQLLNRAVSRYFTCNLRIQISDKIQRLPVSFVDHTPVGDILSRMTEDVSRIGGSLHTVLDTITGGFLQILAIAVVMFLQNWQLSLAVIAFMPVSIWLSAKIAGRSETYFHQMFKQSGELYSVVEEAYTNYATTKAYNLEEHCAERHARINDARRVSEAKATYLSAIVQPVIAASNSLAYIAINLLGGWLIVQQGVPVGVIVTLVLFARQFSEPLEQISNGLSTLQQAKAAAQRVVDLLELPESIRLSTDLSCVRQAEIVVISICFDIHLYLWIADVHYRIFRVRHIVRDGGVDGHGYRRKAADDPHHQCRAEQDACRNEDDAFCFLCHNRTPFLVRVDNPSSYPEHTTALCGSPPQETESIKTLEYTWLPPSDLCL